MNSSATTATSSAGQAEFLYSICPTGFVIPDDPTNPRNEYILNTNCASACRLHLATKEEYSRFDQVALALGGIGLFGMVFVIHFWQRTSSRKRQNNYLLSIFFYAITLLMGALFVLTLIGELPDENRFCVNNAVSFDQSDGTSTCVVQGVLAHLLSMVSNFAWLAMVYDLFLKIVLERVETKSRYIENMVFVIGLPVVIVAWTASNKFYGYGRYASFCLGRYGLTSQTRFLLFQGPQVLCTVSSVLLGMGIVAKLLVSYSSHRIMLDAQNHRNDDQHKTNTNPQHDFNSNTGPPPQQQEGWGVSSMVPAGFREIVFGGRGGGGTLERLSDGSGAVPPPPPRPHGPLLSAAAIVARFVLRLVFGASTVSSIMPAAGRRGGGDPAALLTTSGGSRASRDGGGRGGRRLAPHPQRGAEASPALTSASASSTGTQQQQQLPPPRGPQDVRTTLTTTMWQRVLRKLKTSKLQIFYSAFIMVMWVILEGILFTRYMDGINYYEWADCVFQNFDGVDPNSAAAICGQLPYGHRRWLAYYSIIFMWVYGSGVFVSLLTVFIFRSIIHNRLAEWKDEFLMKLNAKLASSYLNMLLAKNTAVAGVSADTISRNQRNAIALATLDLFGSPGSGNGARGGSGGTTVGRGEFARGLAEANFVNAVLLNNNHGSSGSGSASGRGPRRVGFHGVGSRAGIAAGVGVGVGGVAVLGGAPGRDSTVATTTTGAGAPPSPSGGGGASMPFQPARSILRTTSGAAGEKDRTTRSGVVPTTNSRGNNVSSSSGSVPHRSLLVSATTPGAGAAAPFDLFDSSAIAAFVGDDGDNERRSSGNNGGGGGSSATPVSGGGSRSMLMSRGIRRDLSPSSPAGGERASNVAAAAAVNAARGGGVFAPSPPFAATAAAHHNMLVLADKNIIKKNTSKIGTSSMATAAATIIDKSSSSSNRGPITATTTRGALQQPSPPPLHQQNRHDDEEEEEVEEDDEDEKVMNQKQRQDQKEQLSRRERERDRQATTTTSRSSSPATPTKSSSPSIALLDGGQGSSPGDQLDRAHAVVAALLLGDDANDDHDGDDDGDADSSPFAAT